MTRTTVPRDGGATGARGGRHVAATLLLLALTLLATGARGDTRSTGGELFRIARSTNRNVVVYRARVTATGSLDEATPIRSYWLMDAEDGRREELTWLERQVAYGFSVAPVEGGVRLSLSACGRRSVYVRRVDGRYRAEVTIGGHASYLSRIWVQVDGGFLGPTVRYVVLEGTDVRSGQRTSERIDG